MGNCNKKDENLTITNFEEERWKMFPSSLHPSCAILENIYHPNVRLMKWLGPLCRQSQSSDWPEGTQMMFLPIIYEVGQTRRYSGEIFNQRGQIQDCIDKKQYLITEQLVRVKDLLLTEEQVIIVLHQAFSGYHSLLSRFGGFVAREDMIFINRDGLVKMWVNENLAENDPQFPHPYISQEQFLSSLIRQVCTRAIGMEALMEYLLNQSVSFPRVQDSLASLLNMRRAKSKLDFDKNLFDEIIRSYKIEDSEGFKKSRARSSVGWNGSTSVKQRKNSQHLQFIVGEELNPNSHKKIAYVRDYSRIKVPFSKDNQILNNNHQDSREVVDSNRQWGTLKQSQSHQNLQNGITQVESKVVIYGRRVGGENTFAQ